MTENLEQLEDKLVSIRASDLLMRTEADEVKEQLAALIQQHGK
jgi:hypothetical protein